MSIKPLEELENIRLSIASPEDIKEWSKGEVTKPETINYKSYKPEHGGLFCEIIFGPTKDYRCPKCGKKHKKSDEGKLCLQCNSTTIQSSIVRRRNMGHIELAAPIAHIWFTKVNYSTIAPLLDISQNNLEAVIYFKSFIVLDSNSKNETAFLTKLLPHKQIIDNSNGPKIYAEVLREIIKHLESIRNEKQEKDSTFNLKLEKTQEKLVELEELLYPVQDDKESQKRHEIALEYGIDFYDYNNFLDSFFGIKIGIGAEAIKYLLEKLDLKKERSKRKRELQKTKSDQTKILRKIKIIESFIKSRQNPANMILTVLPVIPPDLRPLIQLDGGRHSSSDINELYRRIIIRNNRLKNWIEIEAPTIVIQNEKRMLQDAVDALFDNERRTISTKSKDGRNLKSLAENLKGKQGRFRKNLLGKRVDYSGRSVIVVGPELKINQCGLPKEMVIRLFEPFIINLLIETQKAPNIKRAKKMIEDRDPEIWPLADKAIKNRPVLLNRAPTLHRLSIQAFEPIIVRGNAIRLHPLVTTPFNADFDGDQMAVHVPLSPKACKEAFKLMQPQDNILGPKDGSLIIQLSQDLVLGIYYLTKVIESKKVFYFNDLVEVKLAYDAKKIMPHNLIFINADFYKEKPNIKDFDGYLLTTAGRVLLNDIFPIDFPYIQNVSNFNDSNNLKEYLVKKGEDLNKHLENFDYSKIKSFKKKDTSVLIELVYEFNSSIMGDFLDNIKQLALKYSTISGTSVSIGDIISIKKETILKEADKNVAKLKEQYEFGEITDDQRYSKVLEIWRNVKESIQNDLQIELEKSANNSLYMMMDSGARGNIANFVQLSGLRGTISKPTQIYQRHRAHNILVRNEEEIPIKSSFKSGLNLFEFYLSTHGARKGLSDTAIKTAESGYLTRRLVDAIQDVYIKEDDCKTLKGLTVSAIYDHNNSIQETLSDRLYGRYLAEDVLKNDKVIAKRDTLISKELANQIEKAGIKEVTIRSVVKCETIRGICKKCYGLDLATRKEVAIGEPIGIISSQSIGEPGTQLTMRTFHTGGVAGVSDITQGFHRLLELLDANKLKTSASISEISGKITSLEENSETNSWKIEITNDNDQVSQVLIDKPIVKLHSQIELGQKLTNGSIQLQKLLDVAGVEAVQKYLISEIQNLYRSQGIDIADKYVEVISRQMLSKVIILDQGDSQFYSSQLISQDILKEENSKLFAQNKKPAFGKIQVLGVKVLPIYSESFIAAASYQRTAESLVRASINRKVDKLIGVKENVILGKKIPIGTGFSEPSGRYHFEWDKEVDSELKEQDLELEIDFSSIENSMQFEDFN